MGGIEMQAFWTNSTAKVVFANGTASLRMTKNVGVPWTEQVANYLFLHNTTETMKCEGTLGTGHSADCQVKFHSWKVVL